MTCRRDFAALLKTVLILDALHVEESCLLGLAIFIVGVHALIYLLIRLILLGTHGPCVGGFFYVLVDLAPSVLRSLHEVSYYGLLLFMRLKLVKSLLDHVDIIEELPLLQQLCLQQPLFGLHVLHLECVEGYFLQLCDVASEYLALFKED